MTFLLRILYLLEVHSHLLRRHESFTHGFISDIGKVAEQALEGPGRSCLLPLFLFNRVLISRVTALRLFNQVSSLSNPLVSITQAMAESSVTCVIASTLLRVDLFKLRMSHARLFSCVLQGIGFTTKLGGSTALGRLRKDSWDLADFNLRAT